MRFKVEDSCGRVGVGDREFLIHPAYGAVVKSTVNSQTSISASQARIINAKKPFDWMGDEQFAFLQVSIGFKAFVVMGNVYDVGKKPCLVVLSSN